MPGTQGFSPGVLQALDLLHQTITVRSAPIQRTQESPAEAAK